MEKSHSQEACKLLLMPLDYFYTPNTRTPGRHRHQLYTDPDTGIHFNLDSLPNNCYLRTGEFLFYVNKERSRCDRINISKKRLKQFDRKMISPCSILATPFSPEHVDLQTLPVTSAAYVRFEDQLFYVNKKKNTCTHLSYIDDIGKIDSVLNTPPLNEEKSFITKPLSFLELRNLTSAIGQAYHRQTAQRRSSKKLKPIVDHGYHEQPLTPEELKEIYSLIHHSPSEKYHRTKDFERKLVRMQDETKARIKFFTRRLKQKFLNGQFPKFLGGIFEGFFLQFSSVLDETEDSVENIESKEIQSKVDQAFEEFNDKKEIALLVSSSVVDLFKKLLLKFAKSIYKTMDKWEELHEGKTKINGLKAEHSVFFSAWKNIFIGLQIFFGALVTLFQVISLSSPALNFTIVANAASSILSGVITLTYLSDAIKAGLKHLEASHSNNTNIAKNDLQDRRSKFVKKTWLFSVACISTILMIVFIANPLAFFIITSSALVISKTGHYVISKALPTLKEEKVKQKKKLNKACECIVTATKTIDLTFVHDVLLLTTNAYIRTPEALFYFNKTHNTLDKIEDKLQKFDQKMGVHAEDFIEQKRELTQKTLRKIAVIKRQIAREKKKERKLGCEVFQVDQGQDISRLSISTPTAYIRFENQLLYLTKKGKKYTFLNLPPERLMQFDEEIGSVDIINGNSRFLPQTERLRLLRTTGQTRSITQKFDERLNRLKENFVEKREALLDRIVYSSTFRNKHLKLLKWIAQGIQSVLSSSVPERIKNKKDLPGISDKLDAIKDDIEKKANEELIKLFALDAESLKDQKVSKEIKKNIIPHAYLLKDLFYRIPRGFLKLADKIRWVAQGKKEINYLDSKSSLLFSTLKWIVGLAGIAFGSMAFYSDLIKLLKPALETIPFAYGVTIIVGAIVAPIALINSLKTGLKLINLNKCSDIPTDVKQNMELDWQSKLAKNLWRLGITVISTAVTLLLVSSPLGLFIATAVILLVNRIGSHAIAKTYPTAKEMRKKEKNKAKKQRKEEELEPETYKTLRHDFPPEEALIYNQTSGLNPSEMLEQILEIEKVSTVIVNENTVKLSSTITSKEQCNLEILENPDLKHDIVHFEFTSATNLTASKA